MPNQNVNKVVVNNQTIIDLTGDTATAADVAQGKTFHDATGALMTGTASPSAPVDSGVIFIDYDGTTVTAWNAEDVAGKTALPPNPSHTGLVSQGWNWTLAEIKSYIAEYPDADVVIGQMYKTSSGLTEFDITVTKVTGKDVICNMVGNKNWGDGTQNNATTHTYADYGDYTITCDGTTIPAGTSSSGGIFSSTASNQNRYWCTAARVGGNVTSIGISAFSNCFSLTSVTIPDSVTSIGTYTFYRCYSLTSVTIPDNVTSIGTYTFSNCFSLTSVTIPDSVTSIGTTAFYGCYSLTSVTIPDSVTSIGNTAFYGCYSLTSVTIPDSVTSIGDSAFKNCYSVVEYDFSKALSVPTLANVNAFDGINGICKIKVPAALYDEWITATNWATYADYIVAV